MSTLKLFRHSTKLFRYYVPTEFVVLAIIEFFVLIFSLYLAFEIRFWNVADWQFDFDNFITKAIVYAIVLQLSLLAFGVYQRQAGRFINLIVLRIASGLLLGLVPLGVSYYFVPTFFLGRGALLLAVAISFLLITVVRLYFRQIIQEDEMWTRVLILGAGKKAELIRAAQRCGEIHGLNIITYVAMPGDDGILSDNVIELPESLINYVEQQDIDEVVIAVDERRTKAFPTKDLIDCKMSSVNVLDLITFFERRAGKIRLDILNPSWLYLSEGFYVGSGVVRSIGKRVLDILFVLILLPFVLPIILLVSLAMLTRYAGPGPILYSQTRVKQDGIPFRIYKFRSMEKDAEKGGIAMAGKNDTRVTRVGSILRKGRLDELPQLFNVLKGDMSFVGPRPERPEYVEDFAINIPYYDERHRVKPGLTGWAQICYSYGETEKDAIEKLQYDLYYVKNYSVLLDVLILLQTAEVVLLGKGAQ